MPAAEAPVVFFADAGAFEAWLEEHVGDHAGVWLKVAKKSSGIASLTEDEAVDAGRMRPAGLAEVEAARADGRWDAAYASQKDATVQAVGALGATG